MSARDPHRFINELDNEVIQRLIARLENRAQDAVFTRLFNNYIRQLNLSADARILDAGCGTGVIVRALARAQAFANKIIGVDQSPAFIAAAADFAHREGVGERVNFIVDDAHQLNFADGSFDVVIAHTLISHVSEPIVVLRELARVLADNGTLVIFDGDYAALSYAYHDQEIGRAMDRALVAATFNNPYIIRELPRLVPQLNLLIKQATADAVAEVGSGSYFRSFAETYAPMVSRAGLLPVAQVDAWLHSQQELIAENMFFACCNYFTYLIVKR